MQRAPSRLFEPSQLRAALRDSFVMLSPRRMARNPVMFTCEIGAVLTTIAIVLSPGDRLYASVVSVVLWLTVLFANFAEALAEARGRAQTKSLRTARAKTRARRVRDDDAIEEVDGDALRPGDLVRVAAGETIPADGEIVRGVASIDESAITGESAPVVREAGGDRSSVTGGTRVLSDEIDVRVTAEPGGSFLDRMIALVEGAKRQKTPNELALTILLSGLTLAFLLVTVCLEPMARYFDAHLDVPTLVALLVCLIPTTIGALLAAIGIAGMDRALAAKLVAKSGRAVELAGDVDTVLLDKTGTITKGNRQATAFHPAPGVARELLLETVLAASEGDDTPEGRSIAILAGKESDAPAMSAGTVVPFSARTRLSGVDLPDGTRLRKGAIDAAERFLREAGGELPEAVRKSAHSVAERGGTPLVVVRDTRALGVVELSDVLKDGIAERFARLRRMGLRIVMVTGDNPITAAFIAKAAGVDDFIAEATPEEKLAYIEREQRDGRLVAMMGDGTNDAPALAQADLGVAMNSGTQAAKEAANMVDLESDPTKLIEVVEIGKQLLMTRGALTTFSIANDVAKYFAIVPALFVAALPELAALDVMDLGSPRSAILSALIFNALVIPALVPLALRGVQYRPVGANALLRRNLLVYGLGGVVAPFVGIKLIDLVVSLLPGF